MGNRWLAGPIIYCILLATTLDAVQRKTRGFHFEACLRCVDGAGCESLANAVKTFTPDDRWHVSPMRTHCPRTPARRGGRRHRRAIQMYPCFMAAVVWRGGV